MQATFMWLQANVFRFFHDVLKRLPTVDEWPTTLDKKHPTSLLLHAKHNDLAASP